jgi:hypothetical protein
MTERPQKITLAEMRDTICGCKHWAKIKNRHPRDGAGDGAFYPGTMYRSAMINWITFRDRELLDHPSMFLKRGNQSHSFG